MSSADWMPRNLNRRVEILFPVEDEVLKEEVVHILEVELSDNVKAHILNPDGSYVKPDRRGKESINSQDYFCEQAKQNVPDKKIQDRRVFEPIIAPVLKKEESD